METRRELGQNEDEGVEQNPTTDGCEGVNRAQSRLIVVNRSGSKGENSSLGSREAVLLPMLIPGGEMFHSGCRERFSPQKSPLSQSPLAVQRKYGYRRDPFI